MRLLLIIVVVALLLSFAGWLAFDFSGNRASVEVRTDKIEQDTDEILETSKDLIHRAEERINP